MSLDISSLSFLKPEQVKQDKTSLSLYGNDWLKQWDGQAGLVLFPKTTEDVVQIVLWARTQKCKLIPSGGRTGLSGGSTALHKEVVVSFDKMNRILDFKPSEQSVTVEAGLVTQTLQDFAQEKELYFPISFAAQGSSQIGGNVATNVGGVHVLRYGSMRQQVIGLEVVTGRGDVLNLGRGLIKNAAGYDLKNLFIGSEGTLGFITKITLKLIAPPDNPQAFLLAINKQASFSHLLESFNKKIRPLAFEVFSDKAMDYVLPHSSLKFPLQARTPFYVLMELEERDQEKALAVFEEATEQGHIQDGIISQSDSQKKELWSLRENISEAISSHEPYKNDICVRTSQMSQFIEEMENLLQKHYPDFDQVWFGHFGDGNLHINILKPKNLTKKDFIQKCERVNGLLFALVQKFGGTISAEHGVGLLKKPYLSYSSSSQEIEIMKNLKKVFDPDNLMNVGKIFDL